MRSPDGPPGLPRQVAFYCLRYHHKIAKIFEPDLLRSASARINSKNSNASSGRGHVYQDLSDGALLHGVVCCRGFIEPKAGQGQPVFIADTQRPCF